MKAFNFQHSNRWCGSRARGSAHTLRGPWDDGKVNVEGGIWQCLPKDSWRAGTWAGRGGAEEKPRAAVGGGAAGERGWGAPPESRGGSWGGPKTQRSPDRSADGVGKALGWELPFSKGWWGLEIKWGKMLCQSMNIHWGMNCGCGSSWMPLSLFT